MAKLGAYDQFILEFTEIGPFRYSLRSDGVVLSQWRYEGKLEKPRVHTRFTKGQSSAFYRERFQAFVNAHTEA